MPRTFFLALAAIIFLGWLTWQQSTAGSPLSSLSGTAFMCAAFVIAGFISTHVLLTTYQRISRIGLSTISIVLLSGYVAVMLSGSLGHPIDILDTFVNIAPVFAMVHLVVGFGRPLVHPDETRIQISTAYLLYLTSVVAVVATLVRLNPDLFLGVVVWGSLFGCVILMSIWFVLGKAHVGLRASVLLIAVATTTLIPVVENTFVWSSAGCIIVASVVAAVVAFYAHGVKRSRARLLATRLGRPA